MLQILYLVALFATILIYFRIADKYDIIDKPNHRSSHSQITLRGGGIIFPISLLFYFVIHGFANSYFIIGLTIISLVSFIDDIRPLSNKIRIIGHLTAVSLLFLQTNLFSDSIWWIVLAYIIFIGTINAYNFMDGINGITGGYSLAVVCSLGLANSDLNFVDQQLIAVVILALLVFNFFNFRTKAKCFAGDVGSVSIAFIILFLLLTVMLHTGQIKYIGFLLIYGLDSISTIIFRMIRRENIFEAHRSHFYQYLANNMKWPHLLVSMVYIAIQVLVNLLIIELPLDWEQLLLGFLMSGALFVGIRFIVEGKSALLGNSNKA